MLISPSPFCWWLTIVELGLLALLSFATPARADSAPVDSVEAQFDTLSAEAIIEFDSCWIFVDDGGKATYRSQNRIRIKREAGLDYCDIDLWENALVVAKKFSGRVVAADGTVILERNRKDLRKTCGFGASYSLYDDICFLSTKLSAGNYPFTLESEYELELSSLFYWPDWLPQSDIPVLQSYYAVDTPADFRFRFDTVGDLPAPVQQQRGDNRRISSWSAANIPPFEYEQLAPPRAESRLRVEFAPLATKLRDYPINGDGWSTLSSSYYEIARKSLELDAVTRNIAEGLLRSDSTSLADLERLHQLLMSRQRYVSINIGIGGWQPHSAGSTYKNRYGDCKDLSTLYAALLGQTTVEPHLVLLRTRNYGRINPDFPTLSNFNHAILMYTHHGDTTWVDPTCHVCGLGDLPDQDEGIFVLVIDPDSGTIVRTPESPADLNRITRTARLTVNADLSALIAVKIDAIGNPSHELKAAAQNLTSEEFGEYLKRRAYLPSAMKILECRYDRYDSTLSQFNCTVAGNLRRVGLTLDDRVHLDPSAFPSTIGLERPDIDKRSLPLDFGYAASSHDSIVVLYPEEWTALQVPARDSVVSAFGSLAIFAESVGDTIKIARHHARALPLIAPAAFVDFIAHQKRCIELTAITTVFSKEK